MDSIIFDLDGTLWDSSEQIAEAWNQGLKTDFPHIKKVMTQSDVKGIMGMIIEDFSEILLGDVLPKEEALTTMKVLCEKEVGYLRKTGGNLFEGLYDTLEVLSRKYPLFIVSNCECGYIEAFLEYHNLAAYFKGSLCSGETGKKKGDNILQIIKKYKLKKPVYVGDTIMDYEAAKEAGIPFIHAAYGYGTFEGEFSEIQMITELKEEIQKTEESHL